MTRLQKATAALKATNEAARAKATAERTATINEIALRTLLIETLETRKSDSLDFHDVAVWNVRTALIEAYEAGKAAASK